MPDFSLYYKSGIAPSKSFHIPKSELFFDFVSNVAKPNTKKEKGFCFRRSASKMAVPNTQPQFPKQGINNNIGVEAAGEHNVLAKHVAFFDMNNDGIVYPWETFKGFRAIGCGLTLSAFAAVFINIGLSQKTRPGKFPSLRFPIEIKNIAKAKHGSDSGVYDTEGRFVPSKFEDIFKKHAHTTPDALTGEELKELLTTNREAKDYAGWLAGYTEWKILYVLCKDKNGLLHKDTVRGVYDGSLFEMMAREKASAQKKS